VVRRKAGWRVSKPKLQKLQLMVDAEAKLVLAGLQAVTGAVSVAEVVRDALCVYRALHELLADGQGVLMLVDREAGTQQELRIPSLERSRAVVAGPVRPLQT
jgi:hypothetical protein